MNAGPGTSSSARPIVVGIAGCSGSGKTTLAAALAGRLGGTHFHLDSYYRDLGHLPLAERRRQNFDHPSLIEVPLLVEHVAALARGERIDRPVYEFSTYTRVAGQKESVQEDRLLLVDGLFALYFPALLPLYHLRLYVEAPDEICLARRLRRDTEERGRTPDSVLRQYEATVRPAAFQLVRPSAAQAHLTLDGTQAVEANLDRILAALRERQLTPGLPG